MSSPTLVNNLVVRRPFKVNVAKIIEIATLMVINSHWIMLAGLAELEQAISSLSFLTVSSYFTRLSFRVFKIAMCFESVLQ